jgi:hypothetical protein
MNDHLTPTALEQGTAPPRRRLRLRTRSLAVGTLAVAATFATLVPLPTKAKASTPPADGIVCTSDATAATSHKDHFVLNARDGYITTPDGNSIYTWSYSSGSGAFQYPGPMLCVHEGDTVTITVKNSLPVATSLMFPAIAGVTKDGKLALPNATELAGGDLTPSIPTSSAATYQFTADHAGTYLYESGTNPEIQQQMGLVGALIVRPLGHDDWVYSPTSATDTVSTQFLPEREFVHLLTEIDPELHQCMESSLREVTGAKKPGEVFNAGCPADASGTVVPFAFDMTKYRPRYFMINGRSFPDTIAPNASERLPSQPYSSLVHVRPRGSEITGNDVYPAVVRYLNAGPVGYPFHPHVENERVLGQDGRKIVSLTGDDISQDQFDIVVPPGGTVDAFFSWVDAESWAPTAGNDIGVPVPQQPNRKDGAFWSGSPYLGYKTPSKSTATSFNECGEYYNVTHSHALFQVTNYGASGGGMLTMVRIDPPGGC